MMMGGQRVRRDQPNRELCERASERAFLDTPRAAQECALDCLNGTVEECARFIPSVSYREGCFHAHAPPGGIRHTHTLCILTGRGAWKQMRAMEVAVQACCHLAPRSRKPVRHRRPPCETHPQCDRMAYLTGRGVCVYYIHLPPCKTHSVNVRRIVQGGPGLCAHTTDTPPSLPAR
jgi:hypothetical protein